MDEGRYEVEGELHKAKLVEMCMELKARLPASMGFTVLLFDYSVGTDHGATFYASTVGKKENIELMTEQIEHLKSL